MSATIPSRPAGGGRWIPWLFAAGFGVTVAVNGTLVFFAVDSFAGLATRDHFRKGAAYNDALAAARAQDALGWTGDLALADGTLELRLAGPDGAALDGARARVRLTRPSDQSRDCDAALAPRGGGRYGASVAFPAPGAWDARVRVERGADVWQRVQRLQVP